MFHTTRDRLACEAMIAMLQNPEAWKAIATRDYRPSDVEGEGFWECLARYSFSAADAQIVHSLKDQV